MRLLFVNQSLGIGGAETFNQGLLTWFSKQGIEINIFATNEKFAENLKSAGLAAEKTPLVVDFIGNWKGLAKGIFILPLALIYYFLLFWRQRKTDIILMSGFIEKIIITPIAKLFKIPVVWIEFAPLQSIFNKFFGFPKFLYAMVKNLPDKIIVPSEHTLCSLSKETGLKRSKFLLIPCAENIDIKIYSKIKPQKNSVCCVSRLEQGKGQDRLLKAWSLVEKEIPQAKLSIVGEGDFKKILVQIVKNLSLKKVLFKGYIKDALAEIAVSEIFVFPTVWPLEGFGLVALEAMALGKPVICFDFGPVPEIVSSETGIIVEKENISYLGQAIIKLLIDKNGAQKLGKKGREVYQQKYTFEKIGPRYLSLFKKIV